jgi:hypothetical protein
MINDGYIHETEGNIARTYKMIEGPHKAYLAKPENYTPPTGNPEDCECGAKGDPKAGRWLIANCPCCDGIQRLVWEDCPCGGKHPVMTTVLPPDGAVRVRYIDNVSPIE